MKVCSVLGEDRECRLVAIRPIYAAGATTWASAFATWRLASGLGWVACCIEAGTGTEEDKTFYRTWLSRIEGLSPSARRIEMQRVSGGGRFR